MGDIMIRFAMARSRTVMDSNRAGCMGLGSVNSVEVVGGGDVPDKS